MFCPKCGTELQGEPKFCNECGAKIEIADTKEHNQIKKLLIEMASRAKNFLEDYKSTTSDNFKSNIRIEEHKKMTFNELASKMKAISIECEKEYKERNINLTSVQRDTLIKRINHHFGVDFHAAYCVIAHKVSIEDTVTICNVRKYGTSSYHIECTIECTIKTIHNSDGSDFSFRVPVSSDAYKLRVGQKIRIYGTVYGRLNFADDKSVDRIAFGQNNPNDYFRFDSRI